MKNKLLLLLITTFVVTLSSPISALANIAWFEVKLSKEKASVWEALDLTINAIDKNWNIYTDYTWDILIFSQDDNAEFPWELWDNTYSFKESDMWSVTFQNAVIFKTPWIKDINVYDLIEEDIFWYKEVEIVDEDIKIEEKEIKITSPNSWTTIPKNKLKISGQTEKNHLVNILVNWKEKETTISDSNWLFEADLINLDEWENVIVAQVLNSNEEIIWTSNSVIITIDSSAPLFLGSTIINYKDVFQWEDIIELKVHASSNLSYVWVELNWLIEELEEVSSWEYTWNITAPRNDWEYYINLTLRNNLWSETKENWINKIIVQNLKSAPEIVEYPENEIENEVKNYTCEELQEWLDIKNIKVNKLRTKTIISWDPVENATSYNIYKKDLDSWDMIFVKSVKDPFIEINITGSEIKHEEFWVKAFLKNEDCEIESRDFSEMTKVQTWPEIIALLLLSLIAWLAFSFISRRKKI